MQDLNGLRFVLFGLFIKDACTAYRIFLVFFPWGGVGGALIQYFLASRRALIRRGRGAYLKGALIQAFTVT